MLGCLGWFGVYWGEGRRKEGEEGGRVEVGVGVGSGKIAKLQNVEL